MKKMLPVVIALVIVAAAALYFFVIRGMGDDADAPLQTVTFNAGTYTTNIKGSTKFLKSTLVLVIQSQKPDAVIEKLSADSPLLRQTVTFALSSLDDAQLRVVDDDQENVDEARQRVIDAINEAFGLTEVTGALFTDYIIS
ncbi:MAG: flagellar basal body-associated FliL family protein [Oscillospiraceae bacterium]|jgi:flagellar basal body-associated protein FliL|nr:flagellar basal body-associated FliL family protein [Oscillospiraceae bacterium]